MPLTIAVAGKGGVGKTTVSGLMVRTLVSAGLGPVLAIDADPNSNLNILLGTAVSSVIADLREEVLERKVPEGMSKTAFLELKLQESIAEGKGFDLLVMGRPEGPGCYCAVNNMLRAHLERVSAKYRYVVIDNEAGLEHLSRRTTNNVDHLLIISTPTSVGIRSAVNIRDISRTLKLNIGSTHLVLNQANEVGGETMRLMKENGLEVVCSIPSDENILSAGESGKPLSEVPENSPACEAVRKLMKQLKILC